VRFRYVKLSCVRHSKVKLGLGTYVEYHSTVFSVGAATKGGS